MEFLELLDILESLSPYERAYVAESLFSLECLKSPRIWEAILMIEEQEEENRVEDYSNDEVFAKYMEFNEMIGTPINLEEYLAERREWEYESTGEEQEVVDGWDEFEKARTEHALNLLREYEIKHLGTS